MIRYIIRFFLKYFLPLCSFVFNFKILFDSSYLMSFLPFIYNRLTYEKPILILFTSFDNSTNPFAIVGGSGQSIIWHTGSLSLQVWSDLQVRFFAPLSLYPVLQEYSVRPPNCKDFVTVRPFFRSGSCLHSTGLQVGSDPLQVPSGRHKRVASPTKV